MDRAANRTAVGKPVGTREVGPPVTFGIDMAFKQYEAEARRVWFTPPGQNSELLTQCRDGRGPVVHHDQRRLAPAPRHNIVRLIDATHLVGSVEPRPPNLPRLHTPAPRSPASERG